MPRDLKKGDRAPAFEMDIALTGADLGTVASWRLLFSTGGTVTEHTPTVTVDPDDPSTALVTHEWAVVDTSEAGTTQVEVEATWPDDTTTTFPTRGTEYFTVAEDLG